MAHLHLNNNKVDGAHLHLSKTTVLHHHNPHMANNHLKHLTALHLNSKVNGISLHLDNMALHL